MSEPRGPGGEALPDQVSQDWEAARSLPAGAVAQLWDVLPPLGDPEGRAQAFCQVHAITPQVLQATLRVCGFWIEQAASIDLPKDKFVATLDGLPGDAHPLRDVLIEGFDRAKQELREGFIKRAVLAHGKVLTGVDWRIDQIRASDRGVAFEAPVVLLTLRHQEGGREGSTTLTTSLAGFENLANVVDQIRGLTRPAPSGSGTLEPPKT